jgi:acyl carrier protein
MLMDNEEFLNDLAEALETDKESLTPDTELESLAWDSLTQVSTIALIDQYFDTTVSAKHLESCQTVGDIFDLINSKKS